MNRACIYLRDEGDEVELRRWERVTLEWCAARGYEVAHLIIDGDGSRWIGTHQVLANREAEVVVVPRRDHIPRGLGRIEVIADERDRPQIIGGDIEVPTPPRRRRPRILP